MPERRMKSIEIACPHQRRVVKASYPCRPDGRYALASNGAFNMELIRCSHDDGRCAETLCALHRYNRRGPGTWYPDSIRAMPEKPPQDDQTTARGDSGDRTSSLDQLC